MDLRQRIEEDPNAVPIILEGLKNKIQGKSNANLLLPEYNDRPKSKLSKSEKDPDS